MIEYINWGLVVVMKKSMIVVLMLMVLVVAGCGSNKAAENNSAKGSDELTKLKIATLIPPMTEILDIVKPLLKEDGIDLEIVVLSDNVQPNEALANKEVDANFFNTFLI